MSFDKNMLKKVANDIRKEGVTSLFGEELRKEAKAMRIAFLSAFIKKEYS